MVRSGEALSTMEMEFKQRMGIDKKTIKVRVAVAIDSKGRWRAVGSHKFNDVKSGASAMNYLGIDAKVTFIAADLPIPEEVEVKAEVESCPTT